MASADFGYCVFILQTKNLRTYLSGLSQKLHIPGSHVHKSGCRLENCRATCVYLCCLY